jgi:hypothetical protein
MAGSVCVDGLMMRRVYKVILTCHCGESRRLCPSILSGLPVRRTGACLTSELT